MGNWIEFQGDYDDIVLSSRIRLARNLKEVPFPNKMNREMSKKVIENIEDSFYKSDGIKDDFESIYIGELDESTSYSFLERHLISRELISNSNRKESVFIINEDETVSIMINEEDHIRLQCIEGGLNLKDAYDRADKFDNIIEENLEYAFDERLGYLTSCPTNLGTGLRASVMLHLPALAMNNEINDVLNILTQVGMTLRGLYGEGSQAFGNIFQISNQITLGISENEIINNLTGVVNQIINQEKLAKEQIYNKHKYELEDRIFRSLGLLRSAVLLNSKECLFNISNVRMGVEMGIIKDVSKKDLNMLLVETQPASLQCRAGTKLGTKERDLKRAELVRKQLK